MSTNVDTNPDREEGEHKCAECPRMSAEPRLRERRNTASGQGYDGPVAPSGGREVPPEWLLETVWLCEVCAVLHDDLL